MPCRRAPRLGGTWRPGRTGWCRRCRRAGSRIRSAAGSGREVHRLEGDGAGAREAGPQPELGVRAGDVLVDAHVEVGMPHVAVLVVVRLEPVARGAGPAGEHAALLGGREVQDRAVALLGAAHVVSSRRREPVGAGGGRVGRQDRHLTASGGVLVEVERPDAEVILSFPGLGIRLGARMLAEIGDDKNRFADASGLKAYASASPVTRASGTKCSITRRWVRRCQDSRQSQSAHARTPLSSRNRNRRSRIGGGATARGHLHLMRPHRNQQETTKPLTCPHFTLTF